MNSFSAMEVQIASIVFVIFGISLFSLLLLFLTDTILINYCRRDYYKQLFASSLFSLFIRELQNNNVTKKKRRRRKRRIRDVEPRDVFLSILFAIWKQKRNSSLVGDGKTTFYRLSIRIATLQFEEKKKSKKQIFKFDSLTSNLT